MKILILNENYPHLGNLMGNVFVHVRAKEYAKKHEVRVFSFFKERRSIEYEGIQIDFFEEITTLIDSVREYKPDRIVIHFYHSWMLESLIKKSNVPIYIWVHGYEALGWYRRIFNYTIYSPVFFSFIKNNIIQQFNFRKLISYSNQHDRIKFVFVSKWMKKITEIDTFSRIKRSIIIPNPIDDNLFSYQTKDEVKRKQILLLRSFNTNKYANDISINAIKILSRKPFFNDLHFTLIGSGPLYKKLTSPLKQFPNVTLHEKAVRQIEIPNLHKDYGIFLCPTRQDAQGVSMCEAMSSGLVPITSNNTAIPEFVQDGKTGILTDSAFSVAEAIEKIYLDPVLFQSMSREASSEIQKMCSILNVVTEEMKYIENDTYQ